ncbi:MAG: hypothetical protein ACTSWN_01035 [Promethearchaeota archaeon]
MIIILLKPVGLTLFLIYVGLLFTGSFLFFKRAYKTKDELKKIKTYNLSLGLFIFFLAIAYVIRIYFMFFIAKTNAELVQQLTATERSADALPDYVADGRIVLLQFTWQLHMCAIFVGFGFLIFATEYLMFRKTKFFVTILTFATIPLVIIPPYEIAHEIYVIMYLSPILWLFVYIIVAKNSAGQVRKNAIMLIIGVFVFIIGVFMNSGTVRGWLFNEVDYHVPDIGAIFTAWISPIVLIIGYLITIAALFNKF